MDLDPHCEIDWRKLRRQEFWGKVGEWASGLAAFVIVILLPLFVLTQIADNVSVSVNHHWWAYRLWEAYWLEVVSFSVPTAVAVIAPREKNEPTRSQMLFTWNSAVAGFWGFVFGILWTVERLGPWLGIPIFLSVFVLAGIAWTRLDARFGYLQKSAQ